MLIRTQDKRSLIDMTGMMVRIPHGLEIRAFSTQTESWNLLGKYSTEEKAMKVLDMIQETYESMTSQLSINGLLIIPCNKVFNMPDDEEVEV